MSGSATNAVSVRRFQDTMARVDAVLRRTGRNSAFANTPPSREPKIGGEPASFSKQEIEALLSKEATGWDQRVKDALGIPENLLVAREDTNVLFSQDGEFGVAKVYRDLAHARVPTEIPKYGIAIDGSGMDSVYFVLVDPTRKIIVRELLSCNQSHTDFEWQAVAASIERAVRLAGRTPEGRVVIHNGSRPYMAELGK